MVAIVQDSLHEKKEKKKEAWILAIGDHWLHTQRPSFFRLCGVFTWTCGSLGHSNKDEHKLDLIGSAKQPQSIACS